MGYIPVSDKNYQDEIIEVSILPSLDSIEEILEKVYRYNTWANKKIKQTMNKIL